MAAATEVFANNATTTVTSGGTTAPASGTGETWTVTSSAAFPAASAGSTQFHVGDPAQPAELIAVTNVSGNTWTVTRGAESTTPVVHAAGFTVYQVITAGGLNAFAVTSDLILAPTGATAETFPRRYADANTAAQASATLFVTAIAMPQGVTVNNITMAAGSTAKGGGSHGWYVLADSSLIVRAVTADQTDTASVWGTINTVYTLPTNSYTTTYTGLYYIGVMVAASTVPTFLCTTATTNSVVALTPVLSGACGGATQSTPLATGSTLASISSSSRQYYAYTS